MFTAVRITKPSDDFTKINELYNRAFPENERGPLEFLFSGKLDFCEPFAFYDADTFCGFACVLTFGDISHILYIAVDETLRGKGYGAAALNFITDYKKGCRIIADIEGEDPHAENNEQRIKRKQFYLRNGYKLSGVAYVWREVPYDILVCGGELSMREFEAFWEYAESINENFARF